MPRHLAFVLVLLILVPAFPALAAEEPEAVPLGILGLPTARERFAAVAFGERTYLIGGKVGSVATNEILVYDHALDRARLTALLPSARWGSAAVSDGTSVYVLGGVKSTGYTNEILRWTPGGAAPAVVASMPQPRAHGSAAMGGDGKIYYFGGEAPGANYATILRFDPASGSVTTLSATLAAARSSTAAVYYPPNGKIYVFGGYNAVTFNELEEFSPSTGTIRANLASNVFRAAPAAVLDGSVIRIYGGSAGPSLSDFPNASLVFDPVADRITNGPLFDPPRESLAASRAASGIYVFGGSNRSKQFDDIICYRTDGRACGTNRLPSITLSIATQGLAVSVTPTTSDPDGDAVSVSYQWGDGTSSTSRFHSYAICQESYTVTATATDEAGGATSLAKVVTINVDVDADQLFLCDELSQGTDPSDADTDDDRLLDGPEVHTLLTSPLDLDSDDDRLGDGDEVLDVRTDPRAGDTDFDLALDGDEVLDLHTDPLVPDTDGDRLADGVEVFVHASDPLDRDTDGDLFGDGTEVEGGSDPTDPASLPLAGGVGGHDATRGTALPTDGREPLL